MTLSQSSLVVCPDHISHTTRMFIPREVGEDEEVSIKEVADAIVKAVGFEGVYTVTCLLSSVTEAD